MPKPKLVKTKEAEARKIAYSKLSPRDKLLKLDTLYGKGKGAHRQRKKLLDKISEVAAEEQEKGIK